MFQLAPLATFAILAAAAPGNGGATDDLKCFVLTSAMAKTATNKEDRYLVEGVENFYRGRLSVIEPNADWVWIAASEQHVPTDADVSVTKDCVDRMARLTHVDNRL